MKKILLALAIVASPILVSQVQAFGYYDQRAQEELEREKAIQKRARLQAKKQELMERDLEAFAVLIAVVGVLLKATYNGVVCCTDVACQKWQESESKKFYVGMAAGLGIATVGLALLHMSR